MSTANKLTYLNGTKQAIKQAINEDFEVIDNNTTFREYAAEISSNNAKYKDLIPKETKNATNTLDISNSAGLDKALVTQYGNTYQDGEPTPDAPVEIQVVTGDNEVVVENRNLWDELIEYGGYSKSTGQKVNTNFYRSTNYIPISANTELCFMKPVGKYTRIYFYDSSKAFISAPDVIYTNRLVSTFTTPENAKYMTFQIDYGSATYNNDTCINISDSNDGTYTKHQSQTYPINLGSMELCKIRDYKDRIYHLNGKWYLEKKMGKVVLDGSESWLLYLKTFLIDNLGTGTPNSICSSFSDKGTEWTSSDENNRGKYTMTNTANQFKCMPLTDMTLEEFKTWLSTHNTIVYYVLATPTTTEITKNNYPTLYNQLNNIKLFEGVNHITMTNESGLDVEFDIQYYKDWKLD